MNIYLMRHGPKSPARDSFEGLNEGFDSWVEQIGPTLGKNVVIYHSKAPWTTHSSEFLEQHLANKSIDVLLRKPLDSLYFIHGQNRFSGGEFPFSQNPLYFLKNGLDSNDIVLLSHTETLPSLAYEIACNQDISLPEAISPFSNITEKRVRGVMNDFDLTEKQAKAKLLETMVEVSYFPEFPILGTLKFDLDTKTANICHPDDWNKKIIPFHLRIRY